MNERFQSNPNQQPQGTESIHDNDPHQETLRAINDHFESLAAFNKETEYRREHDVVLENDFATQIEPIHVTLDTKGTADNSKHSSLHVRLPTAISTDVYGDIYSWAPVFKFDNTNGDVSAMFITPQNVSPESIIAPLLSHSDLPRAIASIANATKDALLQSGDYTNPQFNYSDYAVPISESTYESVFHDFAADMESTPTQIIWDSTGAIDVQLPGNITVNSASVLELQTSNTRRLDYADISTNAFYYWQNIDEHGNQTHAFNEVIDPADLPSLTPEQRRNHPYTVIPVEMIEREQDSTNIVRGATIPRSEYPTTGFAVISVNATSETRNTRYFDDDHEAQEYADMLYKKKLYRESSSDQLTEDRAQAVLETLKALLAYMGNTQSISSKSY